VTADVDLGAGIENRSFTLDAVIKSHSAGNVSTANFSFGTPRRKS
jgi:hypothetical protein